MGSDGIVPALTAQGNALNTDLSKCCAVRSNSPAPDHSVSNSGLVGPLTRPFPPYRITFAGQSSDQTEPARLLRGRLRVGEQHHHAGAAHRRPIQAHRTTGGLRGPPRDVQAEPGGPLVALTPAHRALRVADAGTGVVHPHRDPAVP